MKVYKRFGLHDILLHDLVLLKPNAAPRGDSFVLIGTRQEETESGRIGTWDTELVKFHFVESTQ